MTDEGEDQDGSATWGLVMPFVVCASRGGPYDDQSFVAGYAAGRLAVLLESLATCGGSGTRFTVHTGLLPQLDLMAMRHGFTLDSAPCPEADGWSTATFSHRHPLEGEQ